MGLLIFTLISWTPLGHACFVMGLLNIYLNFLVPSGPRQACNGNGKPLSFFL